MTDKWEPVIYDDWQVGDELRRTDRDGRIYIVTEFVKAMMRGYSSQDNPWERKIKEKNVNVKTTTIHNVWDQNGDWRGTVRNNRCFTPGWTYELVDESEYPKMPIEDGVYRVENEEGNDCHKYFLEMKDGEWHFANGVKYGFNAEEFKIIEKYKRVK